MNKESAESIQDVTRPRTFCFDYTILKILFLCFCNGV